MGELGRYRVRWAARLLLLAGVLGCGGRAGSGEAPDPVPAPVYIPNNPPSAATPTRPAPAPVAASPQAPPRSPPEEPVLEGSGSTEEDAVENILSANCGSCHGPDAPVEGSGGIRFIDDVDRLVAAGLILPLNALVSPIVRVSAQGTMPPPESGLLPMSNSDLGVIISFIDNPRFWPAVYTTPGPAQDGVPATPGPAQDGGAGPPAVVAGVDDG